MSQTRTPRRRPRLRDVAAQFGGTETVSTDAPRYDWRDPYHALLAIGWGPFLLGVLGCYLALNALFGTLYALRPDSVANLPRGRWDDAFFFSVETFATVGYGAMSPQSLYGHCVVTLEIFIGLLATAVLTGLIFVRFARPHANLEFCRQVTVSTQDGVPTLSIRLGNRRAGTIFRADANVTLLRRHRTQEGLVTWRSVELPLAQSQIPALSFAWTVRHVIDAASPMHGVTDAELRELDAQIVVSIAGTDATLAAQVHAVRAYEPDDILWGFRFADVMTIDERGRTRIELARLHDVLPE